MSARPENPLVAWALWYASQRLPVFPCRPRGKEPLTQHGCTDATTAGASIAAWWRSWPDANIGLAVPAGWLVLDVDGPDGEAALHAEGVNVPTTAESTTGRGRHLWYTLPAGTVARNKVGVLPHCDTRASGGYCVAPPSLHPSGVRYSWRVALTFATEAPAWLVAAVAGRPEAPKPAASPDEWAALARDGVGEGGRNATLARLVGHLLRHHVDARVVFHLAHCWNEARCRPALPEGEVSRTVDSVTGAEKRRRDGAT